MSDVKELKDDELEEVSGGVKEQIIEITGTVVEVLGNSQYKVQYLSREITCNVSGKMRQNRIVVNCGDEVVVQLSPYDITRGRIISKNK